MPIGIIIMITLATNAKWHQSHFLPIFVYNAWLLHSKSGLWLGDYSSVMDSVHPGSIWDSRPRPLGMLRLLSADQQSYSYVVLGHI